jgi:predicted dehydrogenase
MDVSRRKFIGSSAAAVVVAGTMAKGKVFGANERIRVCNIGVRGQGRSHIRACIETEGFEVVGICDVDANVLEDRVKTAGESQGRTPKAFRDVRDVMADDSIDAITCATPNHWHSLIGVWACQAGKDAYIEKPMSHNIWEGRQLAEAAKKYGRIVMHGTQSRSSAQWQRDIKLMHEGFIGPIHMAKGFTYKTGNRRSIGHGKPTAPPAHLDWNLWQGPAQEQDYLEKEDGSGLQVHYNWHWFWDYGNGETGNQGVHQMDVAVWGMGKGLPVRAQSMGGRYVWGDQGETPNVQTSVLTYADGTVLQFEIRNAGSYQEAGVLTTGNTFLGADGYYVQGKGFFNFKHEPIPVDVPLPEGRSKWENWRRGIYSRKSSDIPCDAMDGHIASAHCHLSNVSFQLQRTLEFDPEKEKFVGDRKANKLLSRNYRKDFKVPKIA